MTLEEFHNLNIKSDNPVFVTFDGEFIPLTETFYRLNKTCAIKELIIRNNLLVVNLVYKPLTQETISKIKIVKGDITTYKGEAIVNAANRNLAYGGGVCGCIFEAAGIRELQKECNSKGYQEVGSATLTNGYNLHAKYIIHAVGPIYDSSKDEECRIQLAEAYINTFKVCREHNIKTIAFPSISTGVYHFDVEHACEIALRTILREVDSMNKVVIYCYNDETYITYLKAFDSLIKEEKSIEKC